jgi:hypothetical protein
MSAFRVDRYRRHPRSRPAGDATLVAGQENRRHAAFSDVALDGVATFQGGVQLGD